MTIPEFGGHPGNWNDILQMVRLLIESIDSYSTIGVTSRVAIINYSTDVILEVDLSENLNKNELLALIDAGAIKYLGENTRMYSALLLTTKLLKDNIRYVSGDITATQAVIMFTDGVPTIELRQTVPVWYLLEAMIGRDRVHVILVGKYNVHTMYIHDV